jgi:hypothetical protein
MGTNDSSVEVRHPKVAYEHSDLEPRLVLSFLVVLGCAGLVIHVVLWGAFRTLGAAQYIGHQTTNPIMTSNEQLREVGGDPALTFPMPRLQPDPQADLNKFRLREEEQLNSYGWVDQNAGKIRIPIEKAIDIMANTWPKPSATPRSSAKASPAGSTATGQDDHE